MAESQTNAVRQILMNELGLSRESVREEMRKIVRDTAESYLRGDEFKHALDRILTAEVNRQLMQHTYDRERLKKLAEEGIQRAIADRFNISVTVKA